MIDSSGTIDHPASLLAELHAKSNGGCTLFSFHLDQYWLPGAPSIELHAYCLAAGHDLLCILVEDGDALHRAAGDIDVPTRDALDAAARALGTVVIDLSRPWRLDTVRIDKPWGAEIWYTGVEQRGVCSVGGVPLPWIVALAGELCLGAASRKLILLKILDPLPEAVYGDLYFEMHEQKVEVYVVTHVAASAWPDGAGAIRFGFDAEKIAEFESLESFKEAWIDSVNRYREVRLAIDAEFDRFRDDAGIGSSDVVAPALAERWKSRIDAALIEREQQCREQMNAFTAMYPLRPGDVVRVPPFTPHSLQHGVRVVEFQTPHYERYILSFAQKVLTQNHWDTLEAVDKIDWSARFDTTLEALETAANYRVDRVADFDAFEVRRIRLDRGVRYRISLPTYAIVMAIDSPIMVCGTPLDAEQACLVPALEPTIDLTPAGDAACYALLAMPKATP